MGEAAVKEPSMEDILSSIRKIISEEGNMPEVQHSAAAAQMAEPIMVHEPSSTPQMADILEQVQAAEPESAPEVQEDISSAAAAKMATSLASIAETVKSELPIEHEVYAEPEMVAPVVPEQSVWANDIETAAVEEPDMTTAEFVATPQEVHHVEMADATSAEAVQTSMDAIVQSVVEEEMAFKGALMSPSADGAVSGAFDRLKRSAMDDIDAKTEAILRPMLREWLDENLPNMVERLVREEIERVARGV